MVCPVLLSAMRALWLPVPNIQVQEKWPPKGPRDASLSSPFPTKVPLSTSSATRRNIRSDVAVEAQSAVCGWRVVQPYGDVM
jgi:hypothetical protein